MMNSNNVAQRRHNSFMVIRFVFSYKLPLLCAMPIQNMISMLKVIPKPSIHQYGSNSQNLGTTTFSSNLYNPLGMCCPLILCRHKTMSEEKGLIRCSKNQRAERWHDKRMRKQGCNLGDKKLMNNSRCEASRKKKTSSKREGPS